MVPGLRGGHMGRKPENFSLSFHFLLWQENNLLKWVGSSPQSTFSLPTLPPLFLSFTSSASFLFFFIMCLNYAYSYLLLLWTSQAAPRQHFVVLPLILPFGRVKVEFWSMLHENVNLNIKGIFMQTKYPSYFMLRWCCVLWRVSVCSYVLQTAFKFSFSFQYCQ